MLTFRSMWPGPGGHHPSSDHEHGYRACGSGSRACGWWEGSLTPSLTPVCLWPSWDKAAEARTASSAAFLGPSLAQPGPDRRGCCPVLPDVLGHGVSQVPRGRDPGSPQRSQASLTSSGL